MKHMSLPGMPFGRQSIRSATGSVLGAALIASTFLLSGQASAQQADVLHYWTSPSESKAMNALASAFKAKGGTWIDSSAANFDESTAALVSRITGGTQPSAVLTTPGKNLNELVAAGYMRDFDAEATAGKWQEAVPPLVWDNMRIDGHVVALPMGMHADNWVWYSKKIFDELGLKEPKNWDEFFAAADAIKAKGYTALAVGGEPWQEVYVFIDAVLGLGGKDFYKRLLVDQDPAAAQSPMVKDAFVLLRRLTAYTDAASPGRSWNDTTNMVISDRAAMQLMGDWAKGEFTAAGKTAGRDYGCSLSPGSDGAYIIVLDTMAFPKVSKEEEIKGQDLLAAQIMDPAVETAISAAKGSLPARIDVQQSDLDHCAAIGNQLIKTSDNVLPSVYLSLSADRMGQMTDLVTQFWSDPAMTAEDAAKKFAEIFAAQ
jgi:glucose/mannose transport system substrate-binding protein